MICRPGSDLLSHVLRQSTIGAEAFDGRVRDGIGSDRYAKATRPAKHTRGSKTGFIWTLFDELFHRMCLLREALGANATRC